MSTISVSYVGGRKTACVSSVPYTGKKLADIASTDLAGEGQRQHMPVTKVVEGELISRVTAQQPLFKSGNDARWLGATLLPDSASNVLKTYLNRHAIGIYQSYMHLDGSKISAVDFYA